MKESATPQSPSLDDPEPPKGPTNRYRHLLEAFLGNAAACQLVALFGGEELNRKLARLRSDSTKARARVRTLHADLESTQTLLKDCVRKARLAKGLLRSGDTLDASFKDQLQQVVAEREAQRGELQEMLQLIKENQSGYTQLLDTLATIRPALSRAPSVLPPMCLIYLMATWDAFFLDMLRELLRGKPDWAFRDYKLGAGEIYNARSIAVLRSMIIETAIQRLSHNPGDAYDLLKENWGIDINQSGVTLDELKELRARRDIWAHNGGVVNSVYVHLSGSAAAFAAGEKATIDLEYLTTARKRLVKAARYIAHRAESQPSPRRRPRARRAASADAADSAPDSVS